MTSTSGTALGRLADRTGTFAMLALDQRESLRTMLATATGRDITDEVTDAVTDAELVDFKTRASTVLSPHVTAVLLDRHYGLPAAEARHPCCALILAADELHHQRPGGPVTGADLDPEVTPDLIHRIGAAALKILVPWLPGARDRAVDLAGRFMALCRAAEVPGIVEGVFRPTDIAHWSESARNDALVDAARDLGAVGPDLYKGEVPSYGRAEAAVINGVINGVSRRITEVLDCPWVVLSSGVSPADFPGAVAACRAGGASGFLAGRAVWADAVAAPDIDGFLATESVRRLRALTDAARERHA